MLKNAPKVIVGLSGGVDSAVVCQLLLAQNYSVEAVFMKNWEEDDTDQVCTAAQDLKDAQSVADTLSIKLHTVNFAHEYWERVFVHFLSEYKKGRTPNPDILCNKEIKFKVFLDFAIQLGADKIATGHYAKVSEQNGQFNLLRGKDNNKDQSYFLYSLNQQQLSKSLFPLGELSKSNVREIAKESGFSNADKKDSTGICFIGERNFKQFLQQYLPTQPGDIITDDGIIIGRHDGLMYYTNGQRKGLNIGGQKNFAEAPWFVLKKDLKNNHLIVGQNAKHSLLKSQTVTIKNPHWINKIPEKSTKYTAQTRYRQTADPCEILTLSQHCATIKFLIPQYSITLGQSLVLYDRNMCLGGGVIDLTE